MRHTCCLNQRTCANFGADSFITSDYFAIRDEENYQNTLSLIERNQRLLTASEDGQLIRLRVVLDTGADVDHTDSTGETALHKAARGGRDDCVTLLFDRGANVNHLDSAGKTPLNLAMESQHDSTVGFLLLQRGYLGLPESVTQCASDGQTPLYLAASEGRVHSCEALVHAGANINAGKGRRTPLMEAALSGHEIVVILLIFENANLNARDCNGETALLYAVISRKLAICQILLDAGATINFRTPEAPLLSACRSNQEEILNLLIQHGAEVDVQDLNGLTPLHHAAQNGSQTACEVLLSANASVDLAATIDSELYTPRRLAKRCGNTDIVRLLESKGARKGHWYGPYKGQQLPTRKPSFSSGNSTPLFDQQYVEQPTRNRAPGRGSFRSSDGGSFDGLARREMTKVSPVIPRGFPRAATRPLSYTGDVIGASGRRWECDQCGSEFAAKTSVYHCDVCAKGDYDVCKTCIGRGDWCQNVAHRLRDELGRWIDFGTATAYEPVTSRRHLNGTSFPSTEGSLGTILFRRHLDDYGADPARLREDFVHDVEGVRNDNEPFLIQGALEKSSLDDDQDDAVLRDVIERSKSIR